MLNTYHFYNSYILSCVFLFHKYDHPLFKKDAPPPRFRPDPPALYGSTVSYTSGRTSGGSGDWPSSRWHLPSFVSDFANDQFCITGVDIQAWVALPPLNYFWNRLWSLHNWMEDEVECKRLQASDKLLWDGNERVERDSDDSNDWKSTKHTPCIIHPWH